MSKTPNAPPEEIFSIDLNPLKPFLVDLPANATVGMRKQQPGWEAVTVEVVGNQSVYGDRAGITTNNFNRFVELNGQYAQIKAQLPVVTKAHEVLTESLSHVDSKRHRLASEFANSAEDHAKAEGRDPTLRTAYEKTIAYRSIIADKAVKTRQQKSEAKKAAGGAPKGGVPDAPEPAPAEPEPAPGAPGADGGAGGEAGSRIPNPPPEYIFAIDLNPLKAFLVDLPPGAKRGARQVQPGWEEVRQEIVGNQTKYGDRAGITTTDFDKFVAANSQYEQILVVVPILEKAKEVLTESLAYVDDQRHKLATRFAKSAESHAVAEGGDPTLRTAYEKTIAYRSVIADKAVKTRKNKK